MKRVVIESPLSGDFARNIRYARLCAIDCLRRGEAPYASHLLYTQVLNDATPEDRKIGMEAGFAWNAAAELAAVYEDLGVSAGMRAGIPTHMARGTPIERRNLPPDLMAALDDDRAKIDATEGHRPVSQANPKEGIGSTKLPLHLFPSVALAHGSLAMLEGALGYGTSNYLVAGVKASIYKAALDRHSHAWWQGQNLDPASGGLHHLGKALACIAILLDAEAAGVLEDDRPYPGGYVKLVEELTPHVARLQAANAGRDPKHYTIRDAPAEGPKEGT